MSRKAEPGMWKKRRGENARGPRLVGPRLEFRAGILCLSVVREHGGHVENGSKKRSRRMAVRNIKERDEKWTASKGTREMTIELLPPRRCVSQ